MSAVIAGLLSRDCVKCDNNQLPSCEASCDLSKENCVKINQDCGTCAHIRCDPKTSTASKSGVSQGALAGAIVGVILFLAIVGGLYFWYKRSPRFKKRSMDPRDTPASAADVLNRPDPTEKSLSIMSGGGDAAYVHQDVESHPSISQNISTRPTSMRSNPFSDGQSIQTTGTEGTNVIPIALVAPDHGERRVSDTPSRPTRSPELMLNLDHVNVSHDNLRPGAGSLRSGITNVSRNSYMTNASYSSDFLNEAPMIVTPTQGTIRKVVGTVKAEMVDARSPSTDAFRPPTKPGVSSPLAGGAFGMQDLKSRPGSNSSENPFSDAHMSMATTNGSVADNASVSTFGHSSTGEPSPRYRETMNSEIEGLPWSRDPESRPTSMSTQAGSVIDISSATRVNVSNGSLYKTMVGRLVTPTPSSTTGNRMQEEQRKAAEAYAELRQSSQYDLSRRNSGHSAISATADSILEAFPFVPPSPISNRQMRNTPPASPLAKQNFTVTPASPASMTFKDPKAAAAGPGTDEDLPPPPDRRMLGMSTASNLSTASTGLGSFPFHIETSDDTESAPTAYNVPRQRASLDTLAITSDLSSYPLGYDKKH